MATATRTTKDDRADFRPRKWACRNPTCPDPSRWWQAPGGIIRCSCCEPPAHAFWVDAEGTAAEAPQVVAIGGWPPPAPLSLPGANSSKLVLPKRRRSKPYRVRVAGWFETRVDSPDPAPIPTRAHDRCLRCDAILTDVDPDLFCLACYQETPE